MSNLEAMTCLVKVNSDVGDLSNPHRPGVFVSCTMSQVDHAETDPMTGPIRMDINEANGQVPVFLIDSNIELHCGPTENI